MTLIRPLLVPLALCTLAAVARAQARPGGPPPDAPRWSLAGGTFLTRDPGWNYDLGVELAAGIERPLGARLRLDGGVTLRTAPGTLLQGTAAIYPPFPEGLHHAAAASVGLRTATAGPGPYALAGVEALRASAGVSGSGTRLGGAVGLGLAWRRAARSALEARYVALDRAIGTTRGLLTVRYVHRR